MKPLWSKITICYRDHFCNSSMWPSSPFSLFGCDLGWNRVGFVWFLFGVKVGLGSFAPLFVVVALTTTFDSHPTTAPVVLSTSLDFSRGLCFHWHPDWFFVTCFIFSSDISWCCLFGIYKIFSHHLVHKTARLIHVGVAKAMSCAYVIVAQS